MKINPRTLNSVYKQLYSGIRKEKPDFNSMVDAILQISPAYNPEREKIKEEKKKNNPEKPLFRDNEPQKLMISEEKH